MMDRLDKQYYEQSEGESQWKFLCFGHPHAMADECVVAARLAFRFRTNGKRNDSAFVSSPVHLGFCDFNGEGVDEDTKAKA